MLAICFGILFIYWMLRVILCKRSYLQLGLALLSLILFLVLPKHFEMVPTLVLTAILTISLIKNIKKKENTLDLSKLIGWATLYVVGGAIAMLSTAFRSQESQVIGQVILKGHEQSIWTTWQNQAKNKTESAWISSYQVEIQDSKGKTLYDDYVLGDYVGIRAQMILIHWPFQLLGFSHLCRLELVHNGYSTAERHQFFPHMAKALPFSSKLVDKLWNKLFMDEWRIPGIQSTTLESSYLPLREAKLKPRSQIYDLIVGPTGLSTLLHGKDDLSKRDARELCTQ
jgi:hypothetical protein